LETKAAIAFNVYLNWADYLAQATHRPGNDHSTLQPDAFCCDSREDL
jgi:hypothetical protein